MKICKEDICNLSRIPISMNKNPLYKSSLQGIKESVENWEDYYLNEWNRIYNPKTLGDIYNLDNSPLSNFSYNNIFLPWIHNFPNKENLDTAFFNNDVSKTMIKMLKLIESLRLNGFHPEQFLDRKGGITGYFLKGERKTKFYVVSGNHRVAAICALFPDKEFSVNFEKFEYMKPRDKIECGLLDLDEFPNIFDVKYVKEWSSVKSGFISEEVAIKIFNKYMEC